MAPNPTSRRRLCTRAAVAAALLWVLAAAGPSPAATPPHPAARAPAVVTVAQTPSPAGSPSGPAEGDVRRDRGLAASIAPFAMIAMVAVIAVGIVLAAERRRRGQREPGA